MQHAEIYEDAPVSKAQPVHAGGDCSAEYAATKNQQPPAQTALTAGGADTGNDKKHGTAPMLQKLKTRRILPLQNAVDLN